MGKTVDVYLSLGTNMGDRRRNISEALELLDAGLGVHYSSLSSIIESRSWGFSGGDFLNCAVCYRSDKSAEEILDICKGIERRMGRTDAPCYDSGGNRIYKDRIMDIDILLYGKERIDTPRLTVPHPQMEKRDFIMGPLMEIYSEIG